MERKVLGRMFWNRQMDPQLVPIAPDIKRDMRRMLLARLLIADIGEFMNDLQRVTLIAAKTMVKNLASLGNAWIQNDTYVRTHDGSCG